MIGLFDRLSRPFLRALDPEDAHRLAIKALRLMPLARAPADGDELTVRAFGLKFPNPVGFAAGFDKNAQVADALLRLGFGFVEVGTVTPGPQSGNPRPRLFRLESDQAVINRLGFNNAGLEPFAGRLSARRGEGIVGANIGANKDAPDRVADYVAGVNRLWGLCDYFTLNISSPNTPGLRGLQGKEPLEELLGRVTEMRARLAGPDQTPLFLKVAPDLDDAEIGEIVEACVRFGLQAIVVGNTTTSRPDSLRSAARGEAGGLSGAPLFSPSTSILRRFHQAAAGRIDLIGVGGIASGEDAYAKIRAGAKAVQLYTAMVFEGPGLVMRIRRELGELLRADGFTSVMQAAGAS